MGGWHSLAYYYLYSSPGALHFLELFYSSKLHQLLLMDLTSLGVLVSSSPPSPTAAADDDNCSSLLLRPPLDITESYYYVLPSPHAVSAVILPSRTYQSFARVGRVIEKMVQTQQQQHPFNSDCSIGSTQTAMIQWSLVFRDSNYMGDFHTSLLSTLRRCPQISSLSFTSSKVVEEDALLGHLVGQLPPSIRFLSFKSTLSRESVQALCILLRQQNAAFLDRDSGCVSTHHHQSSSSSSFRAKVPYRYESKSNDMQGSLDYTYELIHLSLPMH
jgi:hypothetical protein